MAITVVNGLTDEQLADYELRAEAAMLLALQNVADQMADQIAQIQVAAAAPARLLADVREVWAGCPYGLHEAHTGPCPALTGAVAVLVAADPPPVPDIPGPPGQPYVSPDDLAQMTRLWDEQSRQQLMPVVAEVYHTSAGTVHAQMVDASGVLRLPAVSSLAAEQYLAQAANTFDQVGDALWTNARNSLLDGFKAGDSIPELAARVRGSAQMTAPTATLVARTQVLDASNSGSISTARASGLRLRKGWFSTPDLRTRPSHMTAGHTYGTEAGFIPLEEPFYVGGEACDRPHDPVLSPANRYSCRCTVGYAVSSAAPLQRAQRPQPPLPAQSPGPVIPPLGPPSPVVPPAQLPGSQAVAELRAAQRAAIEDIAAAQQAELAALVADQHAAVDAVLAQQRARFAAQTAEHRARVARFEEQAAKRHIRVDEIAEEHRANMAAVTQQARERAAALDELSVQQSIAIDDILASQTRAIRQILTDEEERVRRISADISAALRRRGVRPVPGRPTVPPVGPAPLQRALPEIDLGPEAFARPGPGRTGRPGTPGQSGTVRPALRSARTSDDLAAAMKAEVRRITGNTVTVEIPPDASMATMREFFEGILQGMERNPASSVRIISWFEPRAGASAYARAIRTRIEISSHWAARSRRRELLVALRRDVDDWRRGLPAWNPRGTGTVLARALHEFGHTVHMNLDTDAISARALAIVRRRAAVEGVTPDDLIRREIGAYATSDELELVAEAYADVAVNGRTASALSREIVDALDEAYNADWRTAGRATVRGALAVPSRTAAQLRAAARSFDVVIPPRLPLPALRQLVDDLESGMPAAQALERAATAVPAKAAKAAPAKAAKKAPAKKAPAPKAPPTKTVQADELQPGDRIYVRERRSDGEIVPAGSGGRLVTVVSSERDRDFLNAQVIRAVDENGNDVLIVSTANPTRGGTGYLNTFDRIRVAPPTAAAKKTAAKAVAKKAPAKKAPAPRKAVTPDLTGARGLSSDPATRRVQLENRVREAYSRLAAGLRPGDSIPLEALRRELALGVSRRDIDEAILRISREARGNLIPNEGRHLMTGLERDAAIVRPNAMGGSTYYTRLVIGDPALRPLPGAPAAAKAAKKAAPVAKKAPAKKAPAPKPLPAPERMTPAALRKELEQAGVELPAKVAKPDLQRWVAAARGPDRDTALAQIRLELAPPTSKPVREVLSGSKAEQEAVLRAVFEGRFGRYTTKVTTGGAQGRTMWVEGKIYNSRGVEVGRFGRQVEITDDGEIWVHHSLLEFDSAAAQGSGFAREFNARALEWYRASGIDGVYLEAQNIGKYAWASQGFDFGSAFDAKYVIDRMREVVTALREGRKVDAFGDAFPRALLARGDLDQQLSAAEAILDRATRFRFGHPQYPTAREISQIGRWAGAGKRDQWFGKMLMLRTAWNGILKLR